MGVVVKFQSNNNLISEQLDLVCGNDKKRKYLECALEQMGVTNLLELDVEDVFKFRETVFYDDTLTENQKRSYGNMLETVLLDLVLAKGDFPDVTRVLNQDGDYHLKKKLAFWLALTKKEVEDIDYSEREKYQEYLRHTIADSKLLEAIKYMDRLVLSTFPSKDSLHKQWQYENKKMFLLYYPVKEYAESLYYVRNKSELVFDFSLDVSITMKKQFFDFIAFAMENKSGSGRKKEAFWGPIQLFYEFSSLNNIKDLEYLVETDIEGFREFIAGKVGTKSQQYLHIVEEMQRYLFFRNEVINWHAHVWFLEKIHIKNMRINPANRIDKFSFMAIRFLSNRTELQRYMKRKLGNSPNSISYVRSQFNYLKRFVRYLEDRGKELTSITVEDIRGYAAVIEAYESKKSTYNIHLGAIHRYIHEVSRKKDCKQLLRAIGELYKTNENYHHFRSIEHNTMKEVLESVRDKMEYKYFLMIAILFETGLRISEVCALKGHDLSINNLKTWIDRYQQKMKFQKRQYISEILYELLMDYVHEMKIGLDDYVFPSSKNGAFQSQTFSKNVKKVLREAGMDYNFKSHDYRHTVATELYKRQGIQTVREWLGHKSTEMTKQYIDASREMYVQDIRKMMDKRKEKEE